MSHLQSVFGALSGSNQQPQQMPQSTNLCQPMQTKPSGLFGQQSNLCQPQQQPMQQPCNNPYLPQNQMPPTMPCHNPFAQPMPPAPPPPTACYLPPNVLEQLRCLTNNSTPIFILPAGLSNNSNANSPCVTPCYSPTCIPYPMPLPIYSCFGSRSSSTSDSDCKCNSNSSNTSRTKTQSSDPSSLEQYTGGLTWNADQHVCKEGAEGTVCTKKNCPASIQLQAMISQLLAYQGVIPSAITRILLKRVPGSNVGDSVDEIMEKAMRCIRQLPKDGLLRESCNSREVTKLLGLYLTSSSTLPRIIPVLTTVQLKCNILKALVENLVASRLMEEQNCGVEGEEPLDRLLLELKSEDQLRQMLMELRERECEERVNVNFAACASQRRISEARLASVQRKIQQVEQEIERRRCDLYATQGQCNNLRDAHSNDLMSRVCGVGRSRISESPDPFEGICLARFKRLNLKPHVGSPETTYERPVTEGCGGKVEEVEKEVEAEERVEEMRVEEPLCEAPPESNVNGCPEGY